MGHTGDTNQRRRLLSSLRHLRLLAAREGLKNHGCLGPVLWSGLMTARFCLGGLVRIGLQSSPLGPIVTPRYAPEKSLGYNSKQPRWHHCLLALHRADAQTGAVRGRDPGRRRRDACSCLSYRSTNRFRRMSGSQPSGVGEALGDWRNWRNWPSPPLPPVRVWARISNLWHLHLGSGDDARIPHFCCVIGPVSSDDKARHGVRGGELWKLGTLRASGGRRGRGRGRSTQRSDCHRNSTGPLVGAPDTTKPISPNTCVHV